MKDRVLVHKALIRPSFLLGVIQDVVVFEAMFIGILLMQTKSVLVFALLPPIHFINMAITKKDYRIYRNIKVTIETRFSNRNLFKIRSSFYG